MAGASQQPTLSSPACFVLRDCFIDGSRPQGRDNQQTVLVIKKARLPNPEAKLTTHAMDLEYAYILLVEKGTAQLAYLNLDRLKHDSDASQNDSTDHTFVAFSDVNQLRITYRHPSSASTHGDVDIERLDIRTEASTRTIDCLFMTGFDFQRFRRVLESLGFLCQISAKPPQNISRPPASTLPPIVDYAEDGSSLYPGRRNSSYNQSRRATSQGFRRQPRQATRQLSNNDALARTTPANASIDGRQKTPRMRSRFSHTSQPTPSSAGTTAQVRSYSVNAAWPHAHHSSSSSAQARPTYRQAYSRAVLTDPSLVAADAQRSIPQDRELRHITRRFASGPESMIAAISSPISSLAALSSSQASTLASTSIEATQETELSNDIDPESQSTSIFANELDGGDDQDIHIEYSRQDFAGGAGQPRILTDSHRIQHPHSISSFMPSRTPMLDPQIRDRPVFREPTQPSDRHRPSSGIANDGRRSRQADSGGQAIEANLSECQSSHYGREDKGVQTDGTFVELFSGVNLMAQLTKDAFNMRENLMEECAGAAEAMCGEGSEEAGWLSNAYKVTYREKVQEMCEAHFIQYLQG